MIMQFIQTCEVEGCENQVEGRTLLCATHNHEQRKAERQKFKPIQKPIPKTSAKRKGKLKEYTPLRKQYLLDHPECQIKLIGCTGKATQIHHCSTSDLDFLNIKTWKSADDFCHNQVERVLSAAVRRERGFLV
jgi:hypothetical protein